MVFPPERDRLSLAELAAQTLVVRASGSFFDSQIRYPVWEPPADRLHHWLSDWAVGGVIVLGGTAAELALRTQQLRDWARYPIVIAADVEEGIGQRFPGATWMPPPMALGAIARRDRKAACQGAEDLGALTAREAIAVGLDWILAPVVDVNNNPDNPVINVRAFGETPDIVSELAAAFIRGTQRYPVLTAAKHFPGHGDTAVDSHMDLPVLPHDRDRLEAIEWPPFRAAIAAGVDAVMTAHLRVPALDEVYPATLSRPILTDCLREHLGFSGLIVTDALVMGAIANRYGAGEAAVLALQAGADVILMPSDPVEAIHGICQAVDTGQLSRDRLANAVERFWSAKGKLAAVNTAGEQPQSTSDLASTLRLTVDRPHCRATVERITIASCSQGNGTIADRTQTATGDRLAGEDWTNLGRITDGRNQTFPDEDRPGRNLIAIDDPLSCDFLGQHVPAIALPRQHGYPELVLLDGFTPSIAQDLDRLGDRPTLMQIFARGNPFRGTAEAVALARDCFDALLQSGYLVGLAIYGSPYLLDSLLSGLGDRIPYRFCYGQMPAAQKLVLSSLLGLDKSIAFPERGA